MKKQAQKTVFLITFFISHLGVAAFKPPLYEAGRALLCGERRLATYSGPDLTDRLAALRPIMERRGKLGTLPHDFTWINRQKGRLFVSPADARTDSPDKPKQNHKQSVVSNPLYGMFNFSFGFLDQFFDQRQTVMYQKEMSPPFPYLIHTFLHAHTAIAGSTGCVGTAMLVGERVLITAAHCVWNDETDNTFPNIDLYMPIISEKGKVVVDRAVRLPVNPDRVLIPQEYKDAAVIEQKIRQDGYTIEVETLLADSLRKLRTHDFAFILLDEEEAIGSQDILGHAKLVAPPAIDCKINITGYADGLNVLKTMSGPAIINKEFTNLFYSIDTSGGQSGSGIWAHDADGKVICVGVHTHGASFPRSRKEKPLNVGVLVTKDKLEILSSWKKYGNIIY